VLFFPLFSPATEIMQTKKVEFRGELHTAQQVCSNTAEQQTRAFLECLVNRATFQKHTLLWNFSQLIQRKV